MLKMLHFFFYHDHIVERQGFACKKNDCSEHCFVGVVQGMITGIRGLCNGLGPALYGFIFYIFHVELNEIPEAQNDLADNAAVQHHSQQVLSRLQGNGGCS